MNTFTHSNKDMQSQNIEGPLKNLFHLGGTMVVDKGFDIRNYLNVLERTGFEKNKNLKKLNPLNSTSHISSFNYRVKPGNIIYNAYLTTFNNVPNSKGKFKKTEASFSTDMTKKKYLNTGSSTNLDYKNIITNTNTNYNSNYNLILTKNTGYSLSKGNKIDKNYSPEPSNENFNIFKAIKEIKKSTQIQKLNIKKTPNKKLFITKIPNYRRIPLAFSKEYVDTVFDSKKVINKSSEIVTFKNCNLKEVYKNLSPKDVVFETDSPFLAPDPYRGKRNESSYVRFVCQKMAEIKGLSVEEVDKITTNNAVKLFNI